MEPTRPITLPPNQPADRFYAGGEAISAFRSGPPSAPHTPEDWVASTTEVRGHEPDGLTRLPDGLLLRDAIAADPEGWLGADHVARWRSDVRLLVKLLDAGQRLPVHAHPDDAFAAAHVGTAHGKAEAWYILRGGVVFLGLRDDVEPSRLLALVREQDTEALLGLLNAVEVAPRDSVLVPPGTLHAIGEGVLIAEVQQPEDLSILVDWRDFDLDGAADGHLGLGFELALEAVDTRALRDPESLIRRGAERGSALVPQADGWFRLDRVGGGDTVAPGFAVVIGEQSDLDLITDGATTPIRTGTTLVVPAGAGTMRFVGDGVALVARPPAP
jgi:mannose-6-phosphate isomerase